MAVDAKELDRRLASLLDQAKALVAALEEARRSLGVSTGEASGEMLQNRRPVQF